MTKNSPAAIDRWAVSTRAHGEVLTASATLPSIELVLLGIPHGFTPGEIQSWLKDLAGVAVETSRADPRTRPIPGLLHHALTGLLFSQSELWSHTGHALPCAAVFVSGPSGTAFGWVGRARVMLLVNGEPYEPQWVIVRDEAGHEAMSASLAADSHVLMTLEYWPQGEDGSQAPVSVDAECGHAAALPPGTAAAPVVVPPLVELSAADDVPAPGVLSAWASVPPPPTPPAPVPDSLPMHQPGLAQDASHVALDRQDATQALPSTFHASATTFSIPQVPAREGGSTTPPGDPAVAAATAEPFGQILHLPPSPPSPLWTPESAGDPILYRTLQRADDAAEAVATPVGAAPAELLPAVEPGHPVGRWLSRVLGFGRKLASQPEHTASEAPDPGPIPLASVADTSEPAADLPGMPTFANSFPLTTQAPQPDIAEPHALPMSAGQPAPPLPAPAPLQRGALAAAGLHEILGAARPARAQVVVQPMAGLTAVSAPSGPLEPPPAMRVTPESGSPGTPPYPMLDVKPSATAATGQIHIEREPVAADPSFGIPRLPQRQAPKPAHAPVPETFVAREATPTAPPARSSSTPAASAPRAPQPPTPPARPPAPLLVTPGFSTATPEVPEPPADFLAEFAASLSVEPVMDPTLPVWERDSRAEAGAAQPPTLPPALRGTPTRPQPPAAARAGRAAQPAPAAKSASPTTPSPTKSPTPARPPAAVPAAGAAPRLHARVASEPPQLAAADVAALMRELPLPTQSGEMAQPEHAGTGGGVEAVEAGEVPDGMLVAQPASGKRPGARSRRAPWPTPHELETTGTPPWRNPWAVGVFIAVLFGIGWLVGHSQSPDNDVHATPISRLLRSVGLGGARFSVGVDSDPPGAWISVDGKDISRRTPATLELIPGEHVVTLSMPDLGNVKVPVKGAQGQKVKVNEALHGSLDVAALDSSLPVKMSLDGEPQGFLPVHVAKLPPGLHEVQFSGPNMQPWGQNVSIGIRQTTQVTARPMTSPATGVVQVQASNNDDNGTAPLAGASVFVDGELRGTTPLSLELPRGPHSLRVTFRSETAPVQVIDLPGGNQRFAAFQFGLDSDLPPLKLQGNYGYLPARKGTSVSASLDGLDVKDVREAWLHVRTPDGLWRRYDMTVVPGPRGALLTVPFPVEMFDAQGRASWYLSAATGQGDEFFTEIQRSAH